MAIGNGSQPAGSAGAEALPYASTIAFLVSQVGACSAQRFEEALSKINLLPREFAVLAIIDGSHSPMNQQAVAEALDIHRNGVVTLVDALEERGWVRRQRAPEDRRSFHLVLTSNGRRTLSRAMLRVAQLENELTDLLGESDAGTLRRLLGILGVGMGLRAGRHPHLKSRPWRSGREG
jgi:DNA-binding MarR family transcriptional regulator